MGGGINSTLFLSRNELLSDRTAPLSAPAARLGPTPELPQLQAGFQNEWFFKAVMETVFPYKRREYHFPGSWLRSPLQSARKTSGFFHQGPLRFFPSSPGRAAPQARPWREPPGRSGTPGQDGAPPGPQHPRCSRARPVASAPTAGTAAPAVTGPTSLRPSSPPGLGAAAGGRRGAAPHRPPLSPLRLPHARSLRGG